MSKRTTFTTISPLPPGISRQVVLDFLHNHLEMIDLNPLVKERHAITPPRHAAPEEYSCTWYSLTDKISYLPGGLATGNVTYTCAFHDLPNGVQTHCYAPAGLDIREKWTLNGSLPGEPREPVELGIGAPATGLYIREDVDMRCNVIMTSFVKKTLKRSHATLVDRLKDKAQKVTATYGVQTLSDTTSSLSYATSRRDSSRLSVASSSTSHRSNSPAHLDAAHQSSPPLSSSHYPSDLNTAYQAGYQYAKPQQSFQQPQQHQYQHQYQHRHQPHYQPQQPHLHGQTKSQTPLSGTNSNEQSRPCHITGDTGPSELDSGASLYPQPLRPRRGSVGSQYNDYSHANGWGAWQPSPPQPMPSVRYREGHPEYPQMNPYSGDGAPREDQTRDDPEVDAAVRASLSGSHAAELEA
ncbi:hypothetical protein VTK73DRAFT_6947 [Phialemonium thermophilum]|uniref:DUF7053 domain-containing protein n=1 Tax=Phialemonium thermophilum TaxID=223376 RepID=A0ABR3XTV3_9PEZI